LWSCGVIMYQLLSGMQPFTGENNSEIIRRINKGNPKFSRIIHIKSLDEQWKTVSPNAIKLIKRMLTYNPEERISAEEALNDIWIMKFATKEAIELNTMLTSMRSLLEFCNKSMLQKAVLSYASGRFMTEEEEKKAREVFEMLDVNGDGQLSREELLEGYKIILNNPDEAQAYVDKVMSQLDMNNNGTIDYKEFLVANFKGNNVLDLRMLRQAFDFFDEVI